MDSSVFDSLIQKLQYLLLQVVTIPVMSMERFCWAYLLGAIVLAYWVYRRKNSNSGSFLSYLFPSEIYKHPSTWVDVKFLLVNKVVKIVCLASAALALPISIGLTMRAMTYLFGARDISNAVPPPTVVYGLFTLALALAYDLAVYLVHWLQHKIPWLWEFHKVHHSAQVLTPATAYRVHPVDDLLAGSCSLAAMGTITGVFHYWYPVGLSPLKLMGLNLLIFLFHLLGSNLRHSHVWLTYNEKLSHLLMSPAQHQIHHSTNPRHFDKNLGQMLSLWDWAFGTLYLPDEEDERTLEVGLGSEEDKEFSGVLALYFTPFVKLAKRLAAKLGGSRSGKG